MSLTFNVLDYIDGAERIGIKREHAEYQARELNKLVDNKLVTKTFLETKLKELEMKIIIKVGGMMFLQTGLVLTVVGFLTRHA